jgi:hypothetical protein
MPEDGQERPKPSHPHRDRGLSVVEAVQMTQDAGHTTPPPRYNVGVVPTDTPPTMEYAEKAAFRQAAFRARNVYPGPVGELIAKELLAIEEFGYRMGAEAFGRRLIAAVETAAIKTHVSTQSAARGPMVTPEAKPA